MIFKMTPDGEWYHHMDDLDALVVLAAHLHVALFCMRETYALCGKVFPFSMKMLAIQTGHVLDCARDLRKGEN